MRIDMLKKLRCLYCHGTTFMLKNKGYEMEIKSGTIICKSCGHQYEIREGIPKFLRDKKVSIDPRVRVFHEHYDRYDSWFRSKKGKVLFESEVKAIKLLLGESFFQESLEVGVGTGEFASKLSIRYGIDPAWSALKIAKSRGIEVIQGVAEDLPFKNNIFDAIFLIVTICYVQDPRKVLEEANRVLKQNGKLVIGYIDRESSWGQLYLLKKREGHLFYSPARFYTFKEIEKMLNKTGFKIIGTASTLKQKPTEDPYSEEPEIGLRKDASFIVIMSRKLSDVK